MVASLNLKNSRADENSKQTNKHNAIILYISYNGDAVSTPDIWIHYFESKENSGRAYLDTRETSPKISIVELQKKENTELQETEQSNF